MTKIAALSIAIGLLICADSSMDRAAVGADDEPLRQRVDRLVQPYLDNDAFVGMTVGILQGGKQEVFGYGRISLGDERVPNGDTIYEIGGATTVLTGILLADAVLRGQVKLDEPAGELLPAGVKMPSKGNRPITLQDLSTHMSGLPRIPDNMKIAEPTNPYADYSENDLYAFLNQHRLVREPGTQDEYSNLGQGLLGHLLCLKEKSTFEDLLRNRITEPLKMTSTRITIGKDLQSRFAPGHRGDGEPTSNWDLPVLTGAGGVRSTVNDLLLFARANLEPPKDKLGEAIEMAWTIHQRPLKEGDQSVGLGWHVMSDGTRWHNGRTGGYYAMILVDRKNQSSVVLLTNTAGRDVEQLAMDIFKMISGKKVAVREFKKPVHVPANDLQKLVGQYEINPDAVFTVEATDGKLMVALTGQSSYQVFPRSETEWFYKVVDATLTFNVDKNGNCDSLVLFQNGIHQTARRKSRRSGENTMPDTWAGALIIAAIVFAFAIYHTLEAWFAHRERMAMIEKGIDPLTGQPIGKETL